MLLTLSTTHIPATDLGYLLHKHPDKLQTFPLAFGQAHFFYPEVDETRCTAALLLDIDPVGLVRGRGGFGGGREADRTLDHYVNDRPYVASSFLSVAIAQVLGTALAGRCAARPELVSAPLPLEIRLAALPCRGGEDLLRRLFEPLDYAVTTQRHRLDSEVPQWGDSAIHTVELRATLPLADALGHLYVLIPVLDNEKHYWVGDAELEKLMRQGEGWLAAHPERELIATRYLKYQRSLAGEAICQLRAQDDEPVASADTAATDDPREEAGEQALSLHEQRHGVILSVLRARGASSVVDLGCGEGRLLRELLKEKSFTRIIGVDISHRALEIAAARLRLDRMPPIQRQRIELLHGSLMYRDARIAGVDAAVLCEVIEHLDQGRLSAMEQNVFAAARPRLVIVTTPNREYNVTWQSLPAGAFRHGDHRFEWTRAEFAVWADRVAAAHGYSFELRGIGEHAIAPDGVDLGTPTQMGVFCRVD